MPYDASNDPYLDENTRCLRNLLGIISSKELRVAEAEITTVIIATLSLPKSYKIKDFTRLLFLEIHNEIFGDIYDWAGKTRVIDISKGDSYFAHAAYIERALDEVISDMHNDKRIFSQDKQMFIEAMVYYYSELNAIHPFREGNGRVIRTFLSLIAVNRGWNIDWSHLDEKINIHASEMAFKGDLRLLQEMIRPIIYRL